MTWKQGLMLGGVLVSAFIVADLVPLTSDYVLRLPESINILGLAIISLLFGASLLRLGPRKFLSRMVTNLKSEHHDHKQSHGHSHHHH